MNEEEARKILGKSINESGELTPHGEEYMFWYRDDGRIYLDGHFKPEELEAMVWWMKNKKA